jgi:hypothetical protein
MEVDPVDDGPKTALSISTTTPRPALLALAAAPPITKEEQARQAIDMLRSEDLPNRVSAAHRLDAVAAVLGPARTREVSLSLSSLTVFGFWSPP